MTLDDALDQCPLIAILRGVGPDTAVEITQALYEAGIRIVEVPLNSPLPLISIARLCELFSKTMLVGAGTVLSAPQVSSVRRAGARLVVAPNSNDQVIRRTRTLGMVSIPGVATPSEAFAAIEAGASALKLFPAEAIPPKVLKAWRAVLPEQVVLIPVGGVDADNIPAYREAGARGFGVGSSLYKPDMDIAQVAENAARLVAACR